MEQNPGEGQNQGFWQKYKNYLLIAGAIAVLILISFAIRPSDEQKNQNEEQNQEQTNGENTDTIQEGDNNQITTPNVTVPAGNVSAKGRLLASDNAARGNLMMDGDQGKIYIATRRDFSDLVGREVTLLADGTINSFTFIGFQETMGDGSAIGGPADEPAGGVQVYGRLQRSDDETMGNYLIISGATNIYLKSQWDYSAWIGLNVDLTAVGTIESFTGARLSRI
ncbi:MAG: hypothetical protein U1C57_02305 [Candidatus Doudnabacteria bacterium]|nr:hypothetical protein [bacterium]MDZ4243913.1 hypothetical protein [Candidatus Doudnabacteria bacterium]